LTPELVADDLKLPSRGGRAKVPFGIESLLPCLFFAKGEDINDM